MNKTIDYLKERHFSLWQSLLAMSLMILVYLIMIHINDALSHSSVATYFNQAHAHISWAPSKGDVNHYLIEITDTRFLSSTQTSNSMTTVKHVRSKLPAYQLPCQHNHSYKVRVKAVSPSSISSSYSQESVLFICDRQHPEITPTPLPSLKKVRLNTCSIAGTFDEPHLASIAVNGQMASINPAERSFEARVSLNPGENWIEILASDLAGNITQKSLSLTYAPLTILSVPLHARIYWNGNYAYLGTHAGHTPSSYNQAVYGKQVIRITHPGFHDYCGMIDFSDLSKDTYTISLTPSSKREFHTISPIQSGNEAMDLGDDAHPFVVDYNLDGKKDLIVGTQDGKIALFINLGTDKNPQFSGHTFLKENDTDIDVGSHAAPFMVDYDNDGRSDLLVGNGDGYLIHYENRGSRDNPLFDTSFVLTDVDGSDIAVDSHCKPLVVDWNQDSKKDIVLGCGSGRLSLYLNQGSDAIPLFSPPLPLEAEGRELEVERLAAPFAADVNSDGMQDLLIGDGEGCIHVYLGRDGEEGIHVREAESLLLNGEAMILEGSTVPFLVDWNNDGNLDLLTGSGDGKICVLM